MLGCDSYTAESGTPTVKKAILDRWVQTPEIPYIVATTALAGGFDYPYARLVLNIDEPESLVIFAQESATWEPQVAGDATMDVPGEKSYRDDLSLLETARHEPAHTGLNLIQQERLRANTELAQYRLDLAGVTGTCLLCRAPRMGIDIPDIRLLVFMDEPRSMLDYGQTSGRGGRDGLPSRAIVIRGGLEFHDPLVQQYMQGQQCRRIAIDRYLDGNQARVQYRQILVKIAVRFPRPDPEEANLDWVAVEESQAQDRHRRTPEVRRISQAREAAASIDQIVQRLEQWKGRCAWWKKGRWSGVDVAGSKQQMQRLGEEAVGQAGVGVWLMHAFWDMTEEVQVEAAGGSRR
ncbi:hypothetical protein B0A55_10994 [Friedmanniomyces simplex]|uniref:DNA 3'-5' helicase n=1 Tax=Friedmanniomyces simplex TaxID=329884 RepID=A0A4U0WJH5_9PEZI|nr:hypothetical protein B0A55_10994 [Friedmanniomyces simplex]